jgi:hypothetical protein
MGFVASLLLNLAIQLVAYAIMPKPKKPKPPEVRDMENPTAEAGRELPVVFGSVRVQGLNLLSFHDKETVMRKVPKQGGKK